MHISFGYTLFTNMFSSEDVLSSSRLQPSLSLNFCFWLLCPFVDISDLLGVFQFCHSSAWSYPPFPSNSFVSTFSHYIIVISIFPRLKPLFRDQRVNNCFSCKEINRKYFRYFLSLLKLNSERPEFEFCFHHRLLALSINRLYDVVVWMILPPIDL